MVSGSFWGCAAKEREKWTGNKEKVWLGIGKKEISHRVANLWVEETEHSVEQSSLSSRVLMQSKLFSDSIQEVFNRMLISHT